METPGTQCRGCVKKRLSVRTLVTKFVNNGISLLQENALCGIWFFSMKSSSHKIEFPDRVETHFFSAPASMPALSCNYKARYISVYADQQRESVSFSYFFFISNWPVLGAPRQVPLSKPPRLLPIYRHHALFIRAHTR